MATTETGGSYYDLSNVQAQAPSTTRAYAPERAAAPGGDSVFQSVPDAIKDVPAARTGVPARGTVIVSLVGALLAAVLDIELTGAVGLVFGMCFVIVCVVAALAIDDRDFFTAAVLPPLVFAATMLVVAAGSRDAVSSDATTFSQGVLGGLAYHAGWLVGGYGAALLVVVSRAGGRPS